MVRIFIALLLSLFYANALNAQEVVLPPVTIGNDTFPSLLLPEVEIRGHIRHPGKYKRRERRQARLEYNVRKVYPYARLASLKIRELNDKIARIPDPAEQKKVIKAEYKELLKTFRKPLTKLTITQGRILVRLIYRETNNTSFAHIKAYKGNFNAYFWQSIALLFGNNLKSDYEANGKDAEIEKIIRKIEEENAPKALKLGSPKQRNI